MYNGSAVLKMCLCTRCIGNDFGTVPDLYRAQKFCNFQTEIKRPLVIKCRKCNEVSGIAKAGQVRGKQRYYCKHCNYYFTLQSAGAAPLIISSKHHATILDIAGRLQISKSTVSRALRNSNEINQETRNAVLKMAQELNYVHNYSASSQVRRTT